MIAFAEFTKLRKAGQHVPIRLGWKLAGMVVLLPAAIAALPLTGWYRLRGHSAQDASLPGVTLYVACLSLAFLYALVAAPCGYALKVLDWPARFLKWWRWGERDDE